LDSSGLNYESIEGNLFDGLEIRMLSYNNKPLFSSALIHWNPLTLFYEKVTITQFDAQGIELENIIAMLNSIQSKKSDETGTLDFTLALNSTHLDINPYVYEGVKFSSFVFETGKIDIAKNLNINANTLYLKFDSDIVNVAMYAKIEDSRLLVEQLDLKNISANDITKLTGRLKSKYKDKRQTKIATQKEDNKTVFFKDIKIKHIEGSMKAVQYGDLKIEGATLHLYEAVVEPSNHFTYQVEKVDFKAKTNFGKLDYKGHIEDANIYAKGHIILDKKLFTKYALPLNVKGLKKLPSSLRLNHDAVWIDIDHKISKLLKIKNDFNLDISKAKHKLHYNYSDGIFSIDSDVRGKMTYANVFELKNKVIIDRKGFSYTGKVLILESTALAPMITDYLLPSLKGEFKGNTKDFEMLLSSNFFNGFVKMNKYKSTNFDFKSKSNNIELKRIISDIPEVLKNELVGLEAKGTLDFKNFKKSKISLNIFSKMMDINAEMQVIKPYKIKFLTQIKNDSQLKKFDEKINFSEIKNLNGTIELLPNRYLFRVSNEQLKLFLDYDTSKDLLNKGVCQIENEEFSFQKNYKNELSLNTRISNIQSFLKKIRRYYKIELPNIDGSVDLTIKQELNKNFSIVLKSPHLKYSATDKTTNIYSIETEFTLEDDGTILIKNYKFRIDDNGYLNVFYSNNNSLLKFKNRELKIEKFWLNDKALITGKYNLETSKGRLKIDAKNYNLNNKDFSLLFKLNLDLKIDEEKLDISGDVNILGGTIRYEVVGTNIVEDADIIIMEEIEKAKNSPLKHLKLYIKIKSQKPLKYVAEDVNLEFFNELSIVKNFEQDMLVTGVSTISNGYYQLEDKKFILDKSHVYFTGDVKKPLLDIKANYEKDEYNVHIFISGTTDTPIVNFNSEPYLTQQEILSLILFDGTGSSSGKGAEAYTLLGGSFAKGLIKSLGVDVDHLLLGTDSEDQLSLEVGRKISKDISVLYLHKDGLDGVKVRIEHSGNFETDIIIQPPNTSSIEFLYKRDR
jgi:hypothetical protein